MHIAEIIKAKEIKNSLPQKILNERFEKADEFGKDVGLPTLFVLKLFKLYGEGKVQSIRSFLKSVPSNKKHGLAIWKLKNLK